MYTVLYMTISKTRSVKSLVMDISNSQ